MAFQKQNFKLCFVGPERRLSGSGCWLLLQRTRREFPAPSAQLPITPPPADLTFSSGPCMHAPAFTSIFKAFEQLYCNVDRIGLLGSDNEPVSAEDCCSLWEQYIGLSQSASLLVPA